MEKYTRNARFCLICNYVSKLIPAVQSRCTRFRFKPLGDEFVRPRLQHVVDQERCGGVGGGLCMNRPGLPLAPPSPPACTQRQRWSNYTALPLPPSPFLPVSHSVNTALSPPPPRLHACSVNMGPGGMDALVALGGGDMRRSLNILQVCGGGDEPIDPAGVGPGSWIFRYDGCGPRRHG